MAHKNQHSDGSLSGGIIPDTRITYRTISGGIRKRGYTQDTIDDIAGLETILSAMSECARKEFCTHVLRKVSRSTQVEFLDALQTMAKGAQS